MKEEEFCEAIKDNYYSYDKFHFDLSEDQVCQLSSLFMTKCSIAKKNCGAGNMHFELLEFEDKQCVSEGYGAENNAPLFLTDAHRYPEDLMGNISLLPHSTYSSSCQILQDQTVCVSEDRLDGIYGSNENLNSNCSEPGYVMNTTGSLVPFPAGVLDFVHSNCYHLNADAASLTSSRDYLGTRLDYLSASSVCFLDSNSCALCKHSVTDDGIPVFSTVMEPESSGMLLVSGNESQLHSNRSNDKSVWSRISGRSKPPTAAQCDYRREKPVGNSVSILPLKVPSGQSKSEVVGTGGSRQDVCKADVRDEGHVANKFSVNFKRRRANSKVAVSADDPPAKQRRKLTRPSFDVSAELLMEQVEVEAENWSLPCANGAVNVLTGEKDSNDVYMVESVQDHSLSKREKFAGHSSIIDVPMTTEDNVCLYGHVSESTEPATGDEIIKIESSCCSQAHVMHVPETVFTPGGRIDPNSLVQASIEQEEGFAKAEKSEKHSANSNDSKQVSSNNEMQTQIPAQIVGETVDAQLPLDEPISSSSPGPLNNESQPQAFVSVQMVGKISAQNVLDVPIDSKVPLKQSDKVGGEGAGHESGTSVITCLGRGLTGEQGLGLWATRSTVQSSNSELVAAGSVSVSTVSQVPCAPVKEFGNRTVPNPAAKELDDNMVLSKISRNKEKMSQDMPLSLVIESSVQSSNIKLQLCDIVDPKQLYDDPLKKDVFSEAGMFDASSSGNPNNQSQHSSLNAASNNSLLNQLDLKSFLQNGLQVSSIRLQLGETPCLILQLGDSLVCRVNGQISSRGEKSESILEDSLTGPLLDKTSIQEPLSDPELASKELHPANRVD